MQHVDGCDQHGIQHPYDCTKCKIANDMLGGIESRIEKETDEAYADGEDQGRRDGIADAEDRLEWQHKRDMDKLRKELESQLEAEFERGRKEGYNDGYVDGIANRENVYG